MAEILNVPLVNGLQKMLGAQLDAGVTNYVTLNNTTNIQAPGVLLVDRIDANGNEKPAANREFITYTGISGNTLTGLTRNADGGSSDQDHAIGSIVEFVADVLWAQALIDTFKVGHDANGVHNLPQINDASSDHRYIVSVSELSADRTITLPLLTGNDEFVFKDHTQTLINKTLTSPVLNTGVSGTAVLDEDTMASNSDTQLATQQSIKAYVDVNGGVGSFWKNSIVNGGCEVAQRPVPNLSTSYQYGQVDRFAVRADGTVSAGTITQTTSPSVTSATYKAIKVAGVTLTGSGAVYLRHRIESREAIKYKNLAASFSTNVFHNVGSTINYTITINKANSENNFSAVTQIATSGNLPVGSGSSTKISLENINSGDLGDCSNGIEIIVKANSGAITNKNFEFANLQFNKGALSGNFNPKSYIEELNHCRRYYIRYLASGGNYDLFSASVQATTTAYVIFTLPVEMLTKPVLSTSTISGANFTIVRADSVANVSALTLASFARPDGGSITATIASSTQGQGGFLRLADTHWLAFSAEI